jgi:hypothetical protein
VQAFFSRTLIPNLGCITNGVQLPDEGVDPFAKDLVVVANDVRVWVVAFFPVHATILGTSVRRSSAS